MCHTHWPGYGIDLIRADPKREEITLRLAENDCHYVVPLHRLARELGWAAPGWDREPEPVLSQDCTEYEGCHTAWAPHYHHPESLHRFEETRVYFAQYVEMAVTECNCHVMAPVELMVRLAAEAERAGEPREMEEEEMAGWQDQINRDQEGPASWRPRRAGPSWISGRGGGQGA